MKGQLPNYQIRPRFKINLPKSPAQIFDELGEALSTNEIGIYGILIEGHATLSLPKKEQHYWSPQLSLSFEAIDGGSLLRGMYSPRPEVWTMFVLFYSVIGFAMLVILVVGYSNWSLGQSAQVLWSVPVLLMVFLSLYLVSYFGQRRGKSQMISLHSFIEDSLEAEINR